MQKAEKAVSSCFFVEVNTIGGCRCLSAFPPVPVFIFWIQTTWNESTWKRMFAHTPSVFLCLAEITPHSGMSSDILCGPCMLPSCENGRIYYFCILSLNIFRKLLRLLEQYACQRMSRNLFQNKMSCASLGFVVHADDAPLANKTPTNVWYCICWEFFLVLSLVSWLF